MKSMERCLERSAGTFRAGTTGTGTAQSQCWRGFPVERQVERNRSPSMERSTHSLRVEQWNGRNADGLISIAEWRTNCGPGPLLSVADRGEP
jgi:hypothetical protein